MNRLDRLANAERPAGDRPSPTTDEVAGYPGYWHGPAVLYGAEWRRRALRAEAEVEALRRALAAWRYRP